MRKKSLLFSREQNLGNNEIEHMDKLQKSKKIGNKSKNYTGKE